MVDAMPSSLELERIESCLMAAGVQAGTGRRRRRHQNTRVHAQIMLEAVAARRICDAISPRCTLRLL